MKRNQRTFFLFPSAPNKFRETIVNLNNSYHGLGNIHTRALKKVSDQSADPISQIINESFILGVFPYSLRDARVVPMHKTGDLPFMNNYRPVSISPLMSEIFEKCMCKS